MQLLPANALDCAMALSQLCKLHNSFDFIRDIEAVIGDKLDKLLECLPEEKRKEIQDYLRRTAGESVSLLLGSEQLAAIRRMVDEMRHSELEVALMNELALCLAETSSDAIRCVALMATNSERLLLLRSLPLSRACLVLDAVTPSQTHMMASMGEGYSNPDPAIVEKLKDKLLVAESETWKAQREEREALLKLASTATLEEEGEVLSLISQKSEVLTLQMQQRYFHSQVEFLPSDFLQLCLHRCEPKDRDLFLTTLPRNVRETYLVSTAKKLMGVSSKKVSRLGDANFMSMKSSTCEPRRAVESVMQVVRKEVGLNKDVCSIAAERMISALERG
jgi:hypothetical protein